MTLNPVTKKYETPPPRFFNKDTGEYENIKPMYFLDPTNPTLGLVVPSAVIREDDAFRRFMEDKETRRLARIERERLERLNPIEPTPKFRLSESKEIEYNQDFDEELAQKRYRETTGVMFSKRGATAFAGPTTQTEELRKRELEKKYGALRPLAPIDVTIEELPSAVNAEEIINAWRNSPAIKVVPQKKVRTEGERVKALVKGSAGKRGWTFAAMRGSYRPPAAIEGTTGSGWNTSEMPTLIGKDPEEDAPTKALRSWRQDNLRSSAWWENEGVAQRSAIREKNGRLYINPMTGKLDDIAPLKSTVINQAKKIETKTGGHNVRWLI
jgi:hypothetical protein